MLLHISGQHLLAAHGTSLRAKPFSLTHTRTVSVKTHAPALAFSSLSQALSFVSAGGSSWGGACRKMDAACCSVELDVVPLVSAA